MTLSRRGLMAGAGAAAATAAAGALTTPLPAFAGGTDHVVRRVRRLFADLPGDLGVKIVAPGRGGLRLDINGHEQMFVGSAIKTFILCEALRQVDAPDVVSTISGQQLDLDESVWTAGSSMFNPPNLSGQVSQRTTHEAMIMHSDNTGTDMMLKHAGPDNVRRFIRRAGLTKTRIPDSTRTFTGYILGASNWETFSWQDLNDSDGIFHRPPLNDVTTLASSADDLVSYYARALNGRFFDNEQTLTEFRRTLTLGDAIWAAGFPLGVSAFCKGGSIDIPGYHALCIPGALYFENRWVYFSFAINWYAPELQDPATVGQFASAVGESLTLVVDALSD